MQGQIWLLETFAKAGRWSRPFSFPFSFAGSLQGSQLSTTTLESRNMRGAARAPETEQNGTGAKREEAENFADSKQEMPDVRLPAGRGMEEGRVARKTKKNELTDSVFHGRHRKMTATGGDSRLQLSLDFGWADAHAIRRLLP